MYADEVLKDLQHGNALCNGCLINGYSEKSDEESSPDLLKTSCLTSGKESTYKLLCSYCKKILKRKMTNVDVNGVGENLHITYIS